MTGLRMFFDRGPTNIDHGAHVGGLLSKSHSGKLDIC
jgi:hypothetical protein